MRHVALWTSAAIEGHCRRPKGKTATFAVLVDYAGDQTGTVCWEALVLAYSITGETAARQLIGAELQIKALRRIREN